MSFPNLTHYSEHFSREELQCHCGCLVPLDVNTNLQNLAVHLEALRSIVGGPLHINDAYRCPAENARVGGAKSSQHMQGKAADIDAGDLTVARLGALAAQVPRFNLGGIGLYPTQHFVHVDYRGDGPARWDESHQ